MFIIVLVITVVTVIYFKFTKPNKYWKEKGIVYLKPWPFFGNMATNFFQRQSIAELIEDMYKVHPDERYIGFHQFLQPTLLIRDPDLIKKITVKEFDVFPNHKSFSASSEDFLTHKNLFNLTVENGWHNVRSTLSPAFTSSKMRMMFPLMQQCADRFTNYFQKQNKTITVELKHVYNKFAIDVIGSTTFGMACNSLEDSTNQLYLTGRNLSTVTFMRRMKFFASAISPALMEVFKISLFGREIIEFFRSFVKEAIRVREKNQIVRHDMLDLLIEAKKGRLKFESQEEVVDTGFAVVKEPEAEKSRKRPKAKLNDDEVTAQFFVFFFAGYESVSVLMAYTTYELAINPDIQEKLYTEIKSTLESCNGRLTYESVLGMKYLDCVISESLRKWSPIVFIDRVSVKPFTIEPEKPREKPLHLEAGSLVWFPVYAIHRDPKYYPSPEKFDPERFNDENKQNIKPFTFLPFGSGPKYCIASRFALLEAKLLFVTLLQKFELVPVLETTVPIQFSKSSFTFLPGDGIWIGYKPRNFS